MMAATTYQIDPLNVHFADRYNENRNWASTLADFRQQFVAHKAKRWLLYEADSFLFSAIFYALLSADKVVVLPQNIQEEHLRSIKETVDASVGGVDISPDIPSRPIQKVSQQSNLSELSILGTAKVYFYTSGSTGQPKVVEKYYWQIQAEIEALEATFGEQVSGSTFLATISHQHIYGLLFKLLWPIQKSHKLIAKVYEYPEHILNKIQHDELDSVTFIASPAHLQRLVTDNVLTEVKSSFATIFSSGGPLDADKNLALQCQLACPITEVYGSTETGGIAWRKRRSIDDELWRTFAGISVFYQQDSELLKLTSPYIDCDEYLADDRVEIIDESNFKLLGRADSIVKIEEKRVSLDEVALRLKDHDYVADAHVLVIGNARKRLAAVIVLSAEGLKTSQVVRKFELDKTFRKYLSDWFEAVVVPKKFRYPTELPYDSRGKLSRIEMEASFE